MTEGLREERIDPVLLVNSCRGELEKDDIVRVRFHFGTMGSRYNIGAIEEKHREYPTLYWVFVTGDGTKHLVEREQLELVERKKK